MSNRGWKLYNAVGAAIDALLPHTHNGSDGSGSVSTLGGADVSRFVYGETANKTTALSNWNTAIASGFVEGPPGTPNAPDSTNWWWGVNFRHTNIANHYGWQMVGALGQNNWYIRYVNNGTWGAWRPISSPHYDYAMKAFLTGGGTMTWNGSSFLWSLRFIVISQGGGANTALDGYYDIHCPTSGTITGVNTANVTATAAGIPIGAWQALYWIMPQGGIYNSGDTAANFRLVSYAGGLTGDIPYNWVLIAIRNDDTSPGFTGGFLYTTANGGAYMQPLWGADSSVAGGANWPLRVHFSANDHSGLYSALSHNHSGVYAAASHGHNNPIANMDVLNGTNFSVTGQVYSMSSYIAQNAWFMWKMRDTTSITVGATTAGEVTIAGPGYGDLNYGCLVTVRNANSIQPPNVMVKSKATGGGTVIRVFNNAGTSQTFTLDVLVFHD